MFIVIAAAAGGGVAVMLLILTLVVYLRSRVLSFYDEVSIMRLRIGCQMD